MSISGEEFDAAPILVGALVPPTLVVIDVEESAYTVRAYACTGAIINAVVFSHLVVLGSLVLEVTQAKV